MDWHNYWLFVAASVALVLVPGPDMAYMLGRTLAQGRRAGLVAVLGVNLGAYVHLTAAVTGLSAILMTSAMAFTVVKITGAAYLVYLGVQTLLAARKPDGADVNLKGVSMRAAFWQGFLCDALNPKVALFYLAFLPQFVDSAAPRPYLQILLLGVTANMVALPINALLVVASSSMTKSFQRSARAARLLKQALGLSFVALGARLAIERR